MATVGPLIGDARGDYCRMTLGSGEKIVVSHEKSALNAGRLTIAVFASSGWNADLRVFQCDLDSSGARAAIAKIVAAAARTDNPKRTPLGALVEYIKDCHTVEAVKLKCAMLMSIG